MIIHAYLKDGFYSWAELFIKSFIFYHGNDHKIFLSTRGLTEEQVYNLLSLYPDLYVSNKFLNIKKIANRARMNIDNILKLKKHIETNAVTKKSFIWKQAISVEDRYRNSILEAMNFYPDEKYLVHFDIYMYFRKHLKDLFKIITSNKISIKFRLKSKLNRKVMGGLIGFKLGDKTQKFMRKWIYYIDDLPLYKKPLGYGQTSFYYAYRDLKDEYKWGNIPSKFISPRFLETDDIWSGNNTNGKVKNLKLCINDFYKKGEINNVN